MPAKDEDIRNLVSVPAGKSLQLHIDAANLLVTEELAGTSLSADRKSLIELYLAAHFTVIAEERGGLTSSKNGESEDSYYNPNAKKMGLSASRWGQQAIALDTSGVLSTLDSGSSKKAQFRVV